MKMFETKKSKSLLRLGSEEGGLFGSLVESRLSLDAGVEIELGGSGLELLDASLLGELLDEGASDGTVHLELLHEGRAGDNEDLGDLGGDLSESLLVEVDVVVKLVLYLNLGPGLLLSLAAFAAGSLLLSLGVLSR